MAEAEAEVVLVEVDEVLVEEDAVSVEVEEVLMEVNTAVAVERGLREDEECFRFPEEVVDRITVVIVQAETGKVLACGLVYRLYSVWFWGFRVSLFYFTGLGYSCFKIID